MLQHIFTFKNPACTNQESFNQNKYNYYPRCKVTSCRSRLKSRGGRLASRRWESLCESTCQEGPAAFSDRLSEAMATEQSFEEWRNGQIHTGCEVMRTFEAGILVSFSIQAEAALLCLMQMSNTCED